jgi:GTPase SAR1 family protein
MIAHAFGTGMAGSGKTSLMQRINSHLHMQRSPSYIINLDPAVTNTPYDPNIDIRDTVRHHARRFSQSSRRQMRRHSVKLLAVSAAAPTFISRRCCRR